MKKRLGLLVLTPLVLLAPAQLAAQGDEPAPIADPAPEEAADISSAEVAERIKLLLQEPDLASLAEELEAETFEVGEPKEGWSEGGINLSEFFAAREGGLSGSILVQEDEAFGVVQQFGVASATMPDGLFSYTLIEAEQAPLRETIVVRVTEDMWLEVLSGIDLIGNAACYRPEFGVTVHSRISASEWSIGDYGGIGMFVAIAPQASKLEVCIVYSAQEDGTLSFKGYTRKGEPYVLMNSQVQTLTIRPASESAERIEKARSPLLEEFAEEFEVGD
ncbi:MAG: hypothetical protein AAF687_11985 [Pseudomonadota bacterium]